MADVQFSSPAEVILFSPVKSFDLICIFCLRKFNKTELIENGATPLIQKFGKSVQRYLRCNDIFPVANLLFSCNLKDIPITIGTCEDCSLLLQDVCDLSDQISLLEMKMNWKLETLRSIITSAGKVPSRGKELRILLNGNQIGKENVKKFRDGLVKETSRKLKSAFPKVRLKRCKTGNETAMAMDLAHNSKVLSRNIRTDIKRCKDATVLQEGKSKSRNMNTPPNAETSPAMIINDAMETAFEGRDFEVEVSETFPFKSSRSSKPLRSSNAMKMGMTDVGVETGVHSPFNEHDDHSDIDENFQNLPPTPFVGDGNPENENASMLNEVAEIHIEPSSSLSLEALSKCHLVKSGNGPVAQDTTEPCHVHHDSDRNSILLPDILVVLPVKQIVPMTNIKLEIPEAGENVNDREGKIGLRSCKHGRKQCYGYEDDAEEDYADDDDGTNQLGSVKVVSDPKLLHKLMTALGIDETSFPSLKLLSLEKVLNARFTCNVHPCTSRTFRSEHDFRKHSLHHGNFECPSCKQVMTYAPKLCDHEISVHVISESKNQAKNKCSRCDYRNRPGRLKLHILKSHLNLSPDKETCPICHLPVKCKSTDELIQHFLEFHDLSNVDYKSILKCDQDKCPAYFRTWRQYTQHKMVAHSDAKNLQETFNCEDCNLHFSSNAKLLSHRKTAAHLSKQRDFPCPHEGCDKVFKSDAELCRHSTMHTNKLRFCQACKKMVIAKNWRHHVRSNRHKNGNEKMKIKIENVGDSSKSTAAKSSGDLLIAEGKDFFKNMIAQAFLKLHEGEFKCNFCDFVVTDVRELPFHEMKHNSGPLKQKEKLVCSRCPFSIVERNDFISHSLKSHLNFKRKMQCPVCDRTLFAIESKEKDNLRNHLKNCHDPSKTKYCCDETDCSAFFNSNYQLLVHRNKHLAAKATVVDSSGKSMVECYVCKKMLKSLLCLEEHLKRCHPEDERLKPLDWKKPSSEEYICDTCGRAFGSSQALVNHVKTHSREPKKWTCDICQKNFRERLRLHLLSHSGPDSWEFTCDVCGRKCISEQKFKDHRKTHDKNSKRFTCDLCGLSYAQRHNLRIHINSKHGDVTTDPARPYKKVGFNF